MFSRDKEMLYPARAAVDGLVFMRRLVQFQDQNYMDCIEIQLHNHVKHAFLSSSDDKSHAPEFTMMAQSL